VFFARWFDPVTGQLLLTETDDGNQIREAGEILAGGLRFPRQIITVSKGKDGTTSKSTITFDLIKVNELAPASQFAVPLPPPRSGSSTPGLPELAPPLSVPAPDHPTSPVPDPTQPPGATPASPPLFQMPNLK
jgi:hypothetical protein